MSFRPDLSDPASGPITWAAYPRACRSRSERLARCVRVECQHGQAALDEGTRLLARQIPGLLREQVEVCPLERLLSRAA